MIHFSFCLIVKNEENHIRKCLDPIKKLAQEIVIIDTGSTDKTVEIASEYTDRIFFFEWINDFSAARNFAMQKASFDYVFFLDADEYTEDFDMSQLEDLVNSFPTAIGRITRRNKCVSGDSTSIFIDPVERFFDRRLYKYTGRIHEQVTKRDSSPMEGYMMGWTVYHEGYMGSPEELEKKGLRNASLLLKDLEENPMDPYTYYQLGQSYGLFNDQKNALVYYEKGMELNPDISLEYVELMATSLGHALTECDRCSEALLLSKKYPEYLNDADFLYMLGGAALKAGNPVLADRYYTMALSATKFYTEGTSSFKAFHNKGCIAKAFENYIDADMYFQKAGTCNKDSHICHNEVQKAVSKLSLVVNITDANCLALTLSSLENQTIGLGYLEVILLAPASVPDEAVAFEKKHPDNVMLISDGASSSENEAFITGYSYSSCSHIILINSGTIILPDTLRLFYKAATLSLASIVRSCSVPSIENNCINSELIYSYSDGQIDLRALPINLNEQHNRTLAKEKRLLKESLSYSLFSCDFINNYGLPEEENLYNNSEIFYIIDNICFIRSV